MPVTSSRLFDFLGELPSCSIERHVITSAAFGDLRRSVRAIIMSLSESGESDAAEIANRLRSVLSQWLSVPVQFDNTILLALEEIGVHSAVETRWGRDICRHYDDACRTALELAELENPVRAKLVNIIQMLRERGRSFRIFCHRRSREHFKSLAISPDGALPDNVFIHTVVEYREAETFDVLLKVGPLRSRGWSSAPDALLTAPRFDTLIQVVWSGCGDEPGFGYDPVSAQLPEEDVPPDTAVIGPFMRNLQLKWNVKETQSRDNTIGRHGNGPDINEFEVFAKLSGPSNMQRATLVQVDEDLGILYPPHSRVLGFDVEANSVNVRLPGETLTEGMFLIHPVVFDARLTGQEAAIGFFSVIWKEKLTAEYRRDPVILVNRLWDAGLELLHLEERIKYWCRPSSTVIHAPQIMHHFEILVKVLGLDVDSNELTPNHRTTWRQLAWDEIRRSRGEAIHTGFLEQQVIDEQLLVAVNALNGDIRSNIGQSTFQLPIPPSAMLQGELRFYKVQSIEEGFNVPQVELRKLCELSRIDQWRV